MTTQPVQPVFLGLPTNLSIRNPQNDRWDRVEVKQPIATDIDMGGHTLKNLDPDHLVPPTPQGNQFLRSVIGPDGDMVPSWTGLEMSDLADHAEIVVRDGSVPMTGPLQMDGQRITGLAVPTDSSDAVNNEHLLAQIALIQQQLDRVTTGLSHAAAAVSFGNTPPATPLPGQYYLLGNNPTGAWSGRADHVAYWTGTQWTFTMPNPGESRLVQEEAATYSWNGTDWVKVASSGSTNAAPRELSVIGDIKQSMLTEPQFKTALGNDSQKWVLADGRDVSGSEYSRITGRNRLPDLRGGYLRMGGQNSTNIAWNGGDLFGFQEDTTRLPRNTFRTSTEGNHVHSGGVHRPNNCWNGGNCSGDTYLMAPTNTGPAGAHTHTVDSGGDAETRPKSYSVNYFIRID